MADIVLEIDHVYKKFKRGEIHDSLRDLIPALTGRFLRSAQSAQLEEREFWALQDVGFELPRGEAFAIIGPNGSGKSTILKLLSGIMMPTRGTVKVKGKLSALIEVGAGFHPDLTGRENIFLNGTILGMTKNEIGAKFDEIVAFSGLEDFIDTPVKRYSSGMYARLGFSVAAHVDPDILLVDEVLSVGDYVFQRKCIERMNTVIKGGSSVIFVSHNLRAVTELCDRSLLLEKGQIVEIGPTHDVVKSYIGRNTGENTTEEDKEVHISKVTVRDETGERVEFTSGQKAWIDVEVCAIKQCNKLAVCVYMEDDNFYSIFDTSTERLGHGRFSLEPAQRFKCTFELDMHLAPGTFHVGVIVYRYDIQRGYDSRFPAHTLFVKSDRDVRGAVNMYPRVIVHEIVPE